MDVLTKPFDLDTLLDKVAQDSPEARPERPRVQPAMMVADALHEGMHWGLIGLGAVLCLIGIIWFFQGINILPGQLSDRAAILGRGRHRDRCRRHRTDHARRETTTRLT